MNISHYWDLTRKTQAEIKDIAIIADRPDPTDVEDALGLEDDYCDECLSPIPLGDLLCDDCREAVEG